MRSELNRVLQLNGLASMAEPAALCAQIAFMVTGHDHFQSLLNTCEPAERRRMYEALVPNLRFPAKPLDVYLANIAIDAEARQLPVMGEGGKLREFRAPEVRSDQAIAQDAVREALAKEHLHLVCRKCTKEAVFDGMRKADCVHAARSAGWTYGLDAEGKGRELCPECDPVVETHWGTLTN